MSFLAKLFGVFVDFVIWRSLTSEAPQRSYHQRRRRTLSKQYKQWSGKMRLLGHIFLLSIALIAPAPNWAVTSALKLSPRRPQKPFSASMLFKEIIRDYTLSAQASSEEHETNSQATVTPRVTVTPTATATMVPTSTLTPEPTLTSTPTVTPTATATVTPSMTVPLTPTSTATAEPEPVLDASFQKAPQQGVPFDAGAAAYYAASYDHGEWFRIYNRQVLYGNAAKNAHPPSAMGYHCVHQAVDQVGVTLILRANGVEITCVTADTVAGNHKAQWRRKWAIELSLTAFKALGLDKNNHVMVYLPQ